jgi:predicted dehydrogenase
MAIIRRIVVVGVGSIGRRHARLLSERDDLEVEICEPDKSSLEIARKELGDLRNHTSFEAVLKNPPEMVVISTPQTLHKEQTIAALQAGCHVLCEKPMSDSLENARAMHAAALSANTILNIGFQNHFHPAFIRIKSMIEEGALGTVLYAHFHVGTYWTLVNSLSRHQRDLEGALFYDYAHQPDLFHWFFGKRPKGIYVSGVQGGELELSSNPNVMDILCDYEEAFLTSIHLNFLQHPARSACEVIGDQKWLYYDLNSETIRLGNHQDGTESTEHYPFERDQMYRLEHQAFFDAVKGEREPESPSSEAIVSMEIIDAGLRSWKEKQRVELSD